MSNACESVDLISLISAIYSPSLVFDMTENHFLFQFLASYRSYALISVAMRHVNVTPIQGKDLQEEELWNYDGIFHQIFIYQPGFAGVTWRAKSVPILWVFDIYGKYCKLKSRNPLSRRMGRIFF